MPTPPKLAAWLLNQFVADEALIGDLVERYHGGRSVVLFWKQVLWAIAIGNLKEIRTEKLRVPVESVEFNPKALLVFVAATGAILYGLEHPSGVVAVFVFAFLFGGLWRLIPEHWLTKRERPTR
jgi:hypothetical protein